ncbi:unnamed protein product [Euphydryas editha]|uniref:Uncharacterized protein n=1 Tax=Euphydryas editha TaxID=104508 RepID=A0AAU9VBU5_EUPED|nr:unnamed protein product [Euphydryas editha]
MANGALLICVISIVLHGIVAKYIIKTKIDSTSYDEDTKIYSNATNITKLITDEKNDTEVISTTTITGVNINDEVNTTESNFNHKKCELVNVTVDIPSYESKQLQSTYLNNMFTGVTMNLIHDDVSIDNLEADGVSLYDLVKSNCGSAKICPNVMRNWSNSNTITIGFLSAYGWSQVRFCI